VGETPFPYHKIKDLLKDGDEVSVQLKVRVLMLLFITCVFAY
jgi:hypothetical protein